MKRILVAVWLLAGCGGVEVAPVVTAPALTKARTDGNASSNPMPGQPPPVANAPASSAPVAPSDPAASNPMPGTPPVDDPLAPGASNPMPGINAGVLDTNGDYTR